MNHQTNLRIAIVGAGRLGHVHACELQDVPDVRVTAVCDIDTQRADELAGALDAHSYGDLAALLANEALDAAYICTPTDTHAALALQCAEAGLHLCIEKPLDMDLRAAAQLVQAVERRGLLACVAFHWRYNQGYARAASLIADAPVALVNMRWYWTRPPIRWMWNRQRAGGQIVDQVIHLLDAAQGLVGPITQVYAAYNSRQVNGEPEFDNWDGYALTLRFQGGAVGTCAGTYGLFPEIQAGPQLDVALRDRLVRLTNAGAVQFTPGGVEAWSNEGGPYRGVNQAFVAALRTGDASYIRTPLRAGLRTTAVALAANHSAQTGQVVDVEQFIAERTDGLLACDDVTTSA